jgi:hypothetical protein
MKKWLIGAITAMMLMGPTMADAKGSVSSGGSHASISSGSRSSISSKPSISSGVKSSPSISSGMSKPTIGSGTTTSTPTISSGRSSFTGSTSTIRSTPYTSGGRTYVTSPSGRPAYVVNSSSNISGFWSHAAAFGAGTLLGSMIHPTGYAYMPSAGAAPVYAGFSFLAMLLDLLAFAIFIGLIVAIVYAVRRSRRLGEKKKYV